MKIISVDPNLVRTFFGNSFSSAPLTEYCLLCTQQRNKCVSLLRKTKINYYGNIDEKDITDNKKKKKKKKLGNC